jgi:hypothetical protein
MMWVAGAGSLSSWLRRGARPLPYPRIVGIFLAFVSVLRALATSADHRLSWADLINAPTSSPASSAQRRAVDRETPQRAETPSIVIAPARQSCKAAIRLAVEVSGWIVRIMGIYGPLCNLVKQNECNQIIAVA